jgi:hypothetical protein
MSSNLMDTSPGGENTQYESIKTVTQEPKKGSGQLCGSPSTSSKQSPEETEKGEKKAENIRYGQAMSEQGVGGFTDPEHNSGSVGESSEVGQTRREQGYDAGREMDRGIGG